MQEMFFQSSGRLNRLRYFKRSFALGVVEGILCIAVFIVFGDEWGMLTKTGEAITMVISIAFLVPYYFLMVRRLHDIDKDEKLAYFCAAISLIYMHIANTDSDFDLYNLSSQYIIILLIDCCVNLYILFAPGTRGDNQYGPDPLA